MPLALTTAIPVGTVDTLTIRLMQWDLENHTITILYSRLAAGVLVDTQSQQITEAAYAAAAGATAKLKVYAALQTAIGASSAGVVS